MMDPYEFLCLADRLIEKPDKTGLVFEENIRTSISRAYYYIFLKIKKQLESLGATIGKLEVHKEVANKLIATDISKAKVVALKLGDLKIKRSKADYDMHLNDYSDPSVAEMAIEEARDIADNFDAINTNELKSKLS